MKRQSAYRQGRDRRILGQKNVKTIRHHEPIEGAFYAGLLFLLIASSIATVSGWAVNSYPNIALAGLVTAICVGLFGITLWVKFRVWRFISKTK